MFVILYKKGGKKIKTLQSGKLILDGIIFILDDCSDTKFFIFDSDEKEGTIAICFDILFQSKEYKNETIVPFLSIQKHETGKLNIDELIGCKYIVENIEDVVVREDTLCIYEHEPMEKYSFTIIEILDNLVHIQLEGVAIIDGYTDLYEIADFFGDVWLRYK